MTLDSGANDYLEKPFVIGEFLARVRSALRHVAREPMVQAGVLVVDTKPRYVEKNGVGVKLTRTEYKLLAALARQAGQPLGHEDFLKTLWGSRRPDDAGHLRVVVRQLRLKIEDDPSEPRILLMVPGVGYVCIRAKPEGRDT